MSARKDIADAIKKHCYAQGALVGGIANAVDAIMEIKYGGEEASSDEWRARLERRVERIEMQLRKEKEKEKEAAA